MVDATVGLMVDLLDFEMVDLKAALKVVPKADEKECEWVAMKAVE